MISRAKQLQLSRGNTTHFLGAKMKLKQETPFMSNNEKVITITPHDLPLHCPTADVALWNNHPKVFLPIQSNSTIRCPYCGTVYRLEGEAGGHH